MDIFEFELRYYSYIGLSERLSLDWSEADILLCVQKTAGGALQQHISETSIEQLREATRDTYTDAKKQLIADHESTIIPESGKSLATYIERLEYELKVIYEMNYNTYFLVVQDYIAWARSQHIVVGPGRWSCAWSLLSYLLGITDLDPLEYDLIFERFLNPGRISMPDIDTDFEDTQRDKVIAYIRDKYGEENVAHIGTYMTMAAKAACKDVARVMGVKFDQSNILSWMITEKTVQKSLDSNSDLQSLIANDEQLKRVVELASRLEGTVRQTGVHACGMIIAPEPAVTYTPLQHPPASGGRAQRDDQRIVSQYDGPTVEEVGLLKMDLLWLRNLSIIKNTIKILGAKAKKEQRPLDPLFQEFLETMYFTPPLNDAYTFQKIFAQGDTSGVFQFESDGMKSWLKKLKPTVFDDLVAMTSLYRPGPMEFIPHYIDRKYGVEKVTYMPSELYDLLVQTYDKERAQAEKEKLVADLSPFMDVTYGIAVYQEQLMRIVQAMAWFSMIEADNLRKWVGKKIRELVEKIKKEFIAKAATHRWYAPETAVWVYEKMIEPAADYSFNKSHAACYSYISYQTAYLKAHHPIEFHAALLRSVEEDTDKLSKFIDEIKMHGFEVKLPCVNSSYEHVAAIDTSIQLWFLSIKWIGKEVASFIEANREQEGPFQSLTDFLQRCKQVINKKSVESLIKSGAWDCLGERHVLLANQDTILDRVKTAEKANGAVSLFGEEDISQDIVLSDVPPPRDPLEMLRYEYEIYKTFLSSHPLDGLYSYMKWRFTFISMFKDVEGFGEFRIMGMIKELSRGMRWGYFLKVEDITWEMEFYLNDTVDLQQFSVVVISGYKWRSAKIDMVVTIDPQKLLRKLQQSGNWKPDETVAQIRRQRNVEDTADKKKRATLPDMHETTSPWSSTNEQSDSGKNVKHSKDNTNTTSTSSTSPPQRVFAMPDDIHILQQVKQVVKQHRGDREIVVGNLTVCVDSAWEKKLLALLDKNSI